MSQQHKHIRMIAQNHDVFTFESIIRGKSIDNEELLEKLAKLEFEGLLTKKIIFYCINCGADLIRFVKGMEGRERTCTNCQYTNTIDLSLQNYDLMIYLTDEGRKFFRGR